MGSNAFEEAEAKKALGESDSGYKKSVEAKVLQARADYPQRLCRSTATSGSS